MQKVESGSLFDVVIVCNGGVERPLVLPSRFDDLRPRVINRKNEGYNLAAWDCGWRDARDYEFYLFLRDQCILKRAKWLSDFEFRMSLDRGIGLLGEHITWDRMTWDYIQKSTERDLGEAVAGQIGTYRDILNKAKIPVGETGSHLVSIILFTTRMILEEIDGFPFIGPSYREAVACEIGLSRLIESKGYRIAKVRGGSYEVIGHLQRTKDGAISFRYKFNWMLQGLLRRLVPRVARRALRKIVYKGSHGPD
jgi:hypothetical protein